MTDESTIRQALVESCQERGVQAEIAKAFEVHPSTVKRWIDGGDIPLPMLKLLDFYFFGTIPPRISTAIADPKTVLDFDEAEYRIIGTLARREGITEEQWIVGRIRSYLAFVEGYSRPALKVADAPNPDAPLSQGPVTYQAARPGNSPAPLPKSEEA